MVDAWAGEAREAGQHTVDSVRNPQIFYDESQIMVRAPSQRFIYGDISGVVTEEISEVELLTYLMDTNPG